MYCYKCGAKVNQALMKCVYCGADFEESRIIIEDEKKKSLENIFPQLYDDKEFKLFFNGKPIVYDNKYGQINQVRNIFGYISKKMIDEFSNYVNAIVDIYYLIPNARKKAKELLDDFFELVIAFSHKNNINTTDEEIRDLSRYYEDGDTIEFQIALKEVERLEDELKNASDEDEPAYSGGRWVGGGFGIRGALKGAAQAAILNAGTSMFHSATHAMKKFAQKQLNQHSINEMKREIFKTRELQDTLIKNFKFSCERTIYGIYRGIIPDFVNKNKFDSNENSKEIIELLREHPCSTEMYKYVYSKNYSKFGRNIIDIASHFDDRDSVLLELTEVDKETIEKCKIKVDDSDEMFFSKWQTLKNIEDNNDFYTDVKFRNTELAKSFKNNIMQLWSRHFKDKFWEEMSKCGNVTTIDELWVQAENNPPIEYFLYRYKEKELRNFTKNNAIKDYKNATKDLQELMLNKNILAMTIWTALMIKLLVNRKEDASKYQEILISLANKNCILAKSLVAEYYYKGYGNFEKNEEKAECMFHKLMWEYSPLATGYIGMFYSKGILGYPKDKSVAEEFLTEAEIYTVPFAEEELSKL